MEKKERVEYWIKSSDNDWQVVYHLFEKGDYAYSLFFCHLVIEKLLKALFVHKFNESPSHTHRLIYLAEKAGLELTPEGLELLETVTSFNIEARYPDEKFSFYKRCTRDFTEQYLKQIEELRQWMLQQLMTQ